MHLNPELIATGISILGNLVLAVKMGNARAALGSVVSAVEFVGAVKGNAGDVKRSVAIETAAKPAQKREIDRAIARIPRR